MPPSKLDPALKLASEGFHVFPLRWDLKNPLNSKLPMLKGGYKIATRDQAIIRKWWEDENLNIGVSTAIYADNQFLLIVDVDIRDGKKGAETIKALEAAGFLFPNTYTVRTASGGSHIYFISPMPISGGTEVLGPGVDVKASGGYVVGPGSAIPNLGEYIVSNESPIAPAPSWLLERMKPPHKAPQVTLPVCELDLPKNIKKAIHYLENEAAEAVSGAGGDFTTLKVALNVKDLGISEAMCLDLMWEHWNKTKAMPLWEWDGLELKVANAYHYGKLAPGARLPEADFEALPDDASTTLKVSRLAIEYACDLDVETDAPYLVDGILDLRGLSVLYGDTNCGKTFIALDLAYHIFLGLPWRGYKTRRGGVLFISAEGGIGIKRRIAAIRQNLPGADKAQIAIIRRSIDLFGSDSDANDIVRLIKEYEANIGIKCELVIVDTLARSIPGANENASQDIGKAIGRLTHISQESLVHVCVVHHTGKDKRDMRGSSALAAAVENTIKVSPGLITFEKQRDEERPPYLGFRLKKVNVSKRKDDGKEITSCVVEATSAKNIDLPASNLSRRESIALNSLETAINLHGISLDEETVAVSEGTWWGHFEQEIGDHVPMMKSDTKRRAFKRMQNSLRTKGEIQSTDSNQWHIL